MSFLLGGMYRWRGHEWTFELLGLWIQNNVENGIGLKEWLRLGKYCFLNKKQFTSLAMLISSTTSWPRLRAAPAAAPTARALRAKAFTWPTPAATQAAWVAIRNPIQADWVAVRAPSLAAFAVDRTPIQAAWATVRAVAVGVRTGVAEFTEAKNMVAKDHKKHSYGYQSTPNPFFLEIFQ